MMTNTQHALLAQMKQLEALANGHTVQATPTLEQQSPSFVEMLEQAINQVNETQQHASDLRKRFEMGDQSVDIAEVMVAASQSSISFEALMQVRNRFVTAYQDVMNMPV